jgi:serine protease Do
MTERESIEKIDKYLRGEVRGEELSAFEETIKRDPSLASKVEDHKLLLERIRFYGRRKVLKEQLDTYHNEIKTEKALGSKQRFIYRKTIFSIAASISAIVLLTVSFYLGSNFSSQMSEKSEYQSLSKEMKKMEAAQNKIIKDLKQSSIPIAANYSGTGFLISSKGYVLTSYHLIKNADSVFVENEQLGRVKAQKIFEDKKYDMALLKIEEESAKFLGRIPYMMKKKNAEIGEKIFTLGFPREDIVFGEGSISSASGYEGDTLAYQISIPVNPGNSGGPLLDEQGNLIGIISGKHKGADASNFAIKSGYIKEFLNIYPGNKIISSQKNSLGYLKRSEQIKKLKPFIFNIRVY